MHNDVLKKDKTEPESKEKRESIRGKLEYYQELIRQEDKRRKEEEKLEI